ncbi:MAG: type I restriction endonuclease subunit R [Pseudanabaena frigida]|uniref:Type I restriction endonuclease subunit R n=1 Tax=Pseudanabaena frigida TaxID=945775 RepID=A0A2W4XWF7_9CYAN|nr:MAG: type I restriction endonuclease subunit R [Pseudanabaena frigida]
MPTVLSITEANLSISDVEAQFGLVHTSDSQFFIEWFTDLPVLTQEEIADCDRIKRSYLYNRSEDIKENGINLLVVSPLLYLAGFFEPPYKVRAEEAIEIAVEDEGIVYRGRIDALVVQKHLWIVLIDSKRPKFNFFEAVPQALAYMMASPNGDRPSYALATNGDGFIFIKRQGQQYSFSSDFSMFSQPQNHLYQVLQILKQLGNIASS